MRGGVTSIGANVMQVIDEKWVPRRYVVLAVAGVIFALVWLDLNHAAGGDWFLFTKASREFTTAPSYGDVDPPVMLLFAYPFTFLSDSVGWLICCALCMGLGLVTIWCVEQTAGIAGFGSRLDRERVVLFGGMFLMYAWALPGARWGHADDVVALTCVALAARALVGGQWLVVSIAMAVAIDTKPWAVLAFPLVAACTGARLRGIAVAGIVTVVPWIPFLAVQHGHLGSLNLAVAPDSGLRYLGAAVGSHPTWPRDVQVLVALPLGVYAVAKDRWYLVPAIAFLVRVNLDPATAPYYVAGAVFGLFVWDTMRPLRVAGARTSVGCIALSLLPTELDGFHVKESVVVAVTIGLRLVVAVAPIAVLFGLRPRSVRQVPQSLP